MTYTAQGDRITLEMTREEFAGIMFALGMAAGGVSKDGRLDSPQFWAMIRLANELNNGNPNFTPYEIPEKYSLKP